MPIAQAFGPRRRLMPFDPDVQPAKSDAHLCQGLIWVSSFQNGLRSSVAPRNNQPYVLVRKADYCMARRINVARLGRADPYEVLCASGNIFILFLYFKL